MSSTVRNESISQCRTPALFGAGCLHRSVQGVCTARCRTSAPSGAGRLHRAVQSIRSERNGKQSLKCDLCGYLDKMKRNHNSHINPKCPLAVFWKLNMDNVVDCRGKACLALNIRRPQWSPNLGRTHRCAPTPDNAIIAQHTCRYLGNDLVGAYCIRPNGHFGINQMNHSSDNHNNHINHKNHSSDNELIMTN